MRIIAKLLSPLPMPTAMALAIALALAACGGSDSRSDSEPDSPPPVGGALHGSMELQATVPASALLSQLNASTDSNALALGGTPICDILIYRIRYDTVGGAGETTTASAALMTPTGSDANCRDARPIVLYAHGTSVDREFNMADLQDQQNPEGLLMAAFFAAQGYIVVAPNYAGYDTSTLTYHPYLVGNQQSQDMIDALNAARAALPLASGLSTRDSGRLFITGYSQGGYVAMATHRAMQAAGMTVTASAPMSGPYALAAFVDALFFGQVTAGAPVYFTFLASAYQKSYGDIYGVTGDVFESRYADGIDSLLPGAASRSELYAQGKLPRAEFFSATPPAAEYADITPATAPANLAPIFAQGFGEEHLVSNAYRLAYLQDAAANPDGGWPTITTGVPAATPASPLRRALSNNDLRNWSPTSPMLLCGGNADPSVLWLNAELMQSYWTSTASSEPVSVLDVDSAIADDDPHEELKERFLQAKLLVAAAAVAQGATDGGAAAVADAYHDKLVPAVCLAAVRSFFAAQ